MLLLLLFACTLCLLRADQRPENCEHHHANSFPTASHWLLSSACQKCKVLRWLTVPHVGFFGPKFGCSVAGNRLFLSSFMYSVTASMLQGIVHTLHSRIQCTQATELIADGISSDGHFGVAWEEDEGDGVHDARGPRLQQHRIIDCQKTNLQRLLS